jgi:hypothetical protein
MVTREHALEVLQKFKAESGMDFGIESLGIFGSVARGVVGDDSDVDVVVKVARPNLLLLSRLRLELEELFRQHVDVVSYRPRMNAFLKERIDQEACYV